MKKITSGSINKKIVGEIDNNSSVLLWNRFFSKRPMVRKLFDEIGNAKTTLFLWCINNKDKKNKIGLTYSQISDETGISLSTVKRTMQIFLDHNFLKKSHRGYYMVNPEVAFRGGKYAFDDAVLEYRDFDKIDYTEYRSEKEVERKRKIYREKYGDASKEFIETAASLGDVCKVAAENRVSLMEDIYAYSATEKEAYYTMLLVSKISVDYMNYLIETGDDGDEAEAEATKKMLDAIKRGFGKSPTDEEYAEAKRQLDISAGIGA